MTKLIERHSTSTQPFFRKVPTRPSPNWLKFLPQVARYIGWTNLKSLCIILNTFQDIVFSVTPPSEDMSRNFARSTFWDLISLEWFGQIRWINLYLYSFLHRFHKYNNYYCMSYNFSWIKCQSCLHIHFIPTFFNNQWSISLYIPGIMHSYFICIMSMWLAITLQSLSLISDSHLVYICCQSWPNLKRGVKEKKYSQKGPLKSTFFVAFSDRAEITGYVLKKSQWRFLF